MPSRTTEIDAGLRHAFQQIEKGGRTAQAFEVWREDYLDQVAVAWVLACVFVRFMEDNHLIDECWLAGDGRAPQAGRGRARTLLPRAPPRHRPGVFPARLPRGRQDPRRQGFVRRGQDAALGRGSERRCGHEAAGVLAGDRRLTSQAAHVLKRSLPVSCDVGDTRFLGDLYQDLSEQARKKYALLQTPVFVEEFILDRTLTPAIDEFGLEKVRLIDPTCGSGHFLLGGVRPALSTCGCKRESNEIDAAQKALDGVWGVDINPFAVAIARFRLIVAALAGLRDQTEAEATHPAGRSPGCRRQPAFGSSPVRAANECGSSRARRSVRDCPTIYAVEDRPRRSADSRPGLPRRRRQPAVHHGQGLNAE